MLRKQLILLALSFPLGWEPVFSDFVFCQLMVVGTNSAPTGIPNLGCGEEGNFILCKQLNGDAPWLREQHGLEQVDSVTAQLWSGMAVR